jgi:hypothetical protein
MRVIYRNEFHGGIHQRSNECQIAREAIQLSDTLCRGNLLCMGLIL